MGVNLFVTLWLARQLGPESFGTLSYLLAVVMLAAPLAALGLNALITRELVESPDQEAKIMATAGLLRLVGATSGFLLIALWATLGSGFTSSIERYALVILAACNIASALQLVEFFFQAKVAARYVVKLRTTLTIIFATLKLFAAWQYGTLVSVSIVFAAEFLALGVGFYWLYYFYGKNRGDYPQQAGFQWRLFDFTYAKGLLKQSVWLILSGLAAAFYLKIDQVMLASMVNHQAVGEYAVAVRLSEVWYFFAEALVISFFPMLLTLKKQSNGTYEQRLQSLCDGLFISALILAVFVGFTATPVITFLFGDAYAASGTILSIHIWAGVFVFMRALASKWLIAERLLVFSLVSHGLGAVINLLANILLIPKWGGEGAAIATVISYATASYIAFWFSPATRPLAMVMTRSLWLPFTAGYRYWSVVARRI